MSTDRNQREEISSLWRIHPMAAVRHEEGPGAFRVLSLRILSAAMLCIPLVGRISNASRVQPPTSQAPAPTAPAPAPEIQRLANMLAGRWSIRQTFEPRSGMPNGGVGQGTEVWRPGPGARSLMEEFQSRVGDREFSGLGIIWWDTLAQGYQVVWCGVANPRGCVIMSKLAHWENGNFVIGDEYERDGRRVVYREVFSDFTHESFSQTIYEAEPKAELKRTLTIHATKISNPPPTHD